jgi:ATP-dependent Clp protease ATP-binding subunit ClpA
MFERYTERARRVLFFARYEASQLGSVSIETEHLLLGLIREGKGLTARIFARSHLSLESIRKEIEGRSVFREKVSTSVEIPFSAETKRVLGFAAEESDRLLHNYIGTEHLLLGILREEGSIAASVLMDKGMRLDTVREDIVQLLKEPETKSHGDVVVERSGGRIPGARTLPHYVPSRTVHITYSSCSPQEDAWIQHAGPTWRAFGYTLAQIVAHAWATAESMVRVDVPDLDERTRYNFTIVLPHAESKDVVPQLLQDAIQRDFEVVVSRDEETSGLVVKSR